MWPYLPQNPNCCTDCEQNCTSSNTVCYTGPNLICSGINTNDTITVALQKIEYELCLLLSQTTTTTTTLVNEPICFTTVIESEDPWSCSTESSGTYNGKPYYELLSNDCLTPVGAFVWWDTDTNRWILSLDLGDDSNIEMYNENPGLFPVSDITYPWVYENLIITIISSTLGECPISPMCFSMGGEVPGSNYFCSVEPETNLINGKPYYKIFLPDCTTPFAPDGEPLYVWFSTSGDYVNQWVVSELNNATTGNVYSYISSVAQYYPIGTWEPFADNFFVYDSSIGPCPASPA